MSYQKNVYQLLGKLTSANMNSTSDQAININASTYLIHRIISTNASTSLTLAVGGIYDATSKGGNVLVPNTQVFSALTSGTKYVDLTLGSFLVSNVLSATTLYLSLTVAQGGAATADIYIFGEVL